ncbi:MAG: hypothetical protein V4671_12880, partial [Armatimonadota bacterium]
MKKQVNHRRLSHPSARPAKAADATALAALLAVLGLWGAYPATTEAYPGVGAPPAPTPAPNPSSTPTPWAIPMALPPESNPAPAPTPTPTPTPWAIPMALPSQGTPVPAAVAPNPGVAKTETKPAETKSEKDAEAAADKIKPPLSNGEKILGKIGKDLNISGGMSLSSQQSAISGGDLAQETYNQQNGQTFDTRRLGPFNQAMDLTIQGKIFNAFSVNARLTNSRYGNFLNQRFGFNYKSGGTAVNVGDVNASLGGNELVSFARSLQGLQFSRDFGGGKVKMSGIASLTRALTRRGTFTGNGTTGPYYLNGSNILEGTEKLRLNGTELVAGTDYRIDYILGQVTFSAGRIV